MFFNENYRKDMQMRKKYGAASFLFDIFMVLMTGGIWLIWIFVREMRRR